MSKFKCKVKQYEQGQIPAPCSQFFSFPFPCKLVFLCQRGILCLKAYFTVAVNQTLDKYFCASVTLPSAQFISKVNTNLI